MMDIVQNKPNSSVQHTPSSESFEGTCLFFHAELLILGKNITIGQYMVQDTANFQGTIISMLTSCQRSEGLILYILLTETHSAISDTQILLLQCNFDAESFTVDIQDMYI
jgi:hypothetical protein